MATNRRNATSEDLRNEVLDKIHQYTQNDFPYKDKPYTHLLNQLFEVTNFYTL